MPRGSQTAGTHIGTGEWVKNHLNEVGEDYVLNMFNQMKQHFKNLKPGKVYSVGNYQTFRTYIWMLKELKLITIVREEGSDKPHPKRYYALNQDKINESAWNNPRDALYGKPKKGGKK